MKSCDSSEPSTTSIPFIHSFLSLAKATISFTFPPPHCTSMHKVCQKLLIKEGKGEVNSIMIEKGEFEGVSMYKHQRTAKIRCLITSKNKSKEPPTRSLGFIGCRIVFDVLNQCFSCAKKVNQMENKVNICCYQNRSGKPSRKTSLIKFKIYK